MRRADTSCGRTLWQSDANFNAHCYCYCDSYGYINTYSYRYSPTHANAKI